MSVLDTMTEATALVRRVTLCLNGALQTEYDRLTSQLQEAAFNDRDSLAADNTRAVVDEMEKIRERMAETEVVFSFAALPWLRRLTLQGEHPAREGSAVDREAGHNVETYTTALIRAACASVQGIDGEIVTEIPDAVWDSMLGKLNYSQIDVLYSAAQAANDSAVTVPLSARSLLATRPLGATSPSREAGTPRRADSKVGNRATPPRSSATKRATSPPITPRATRQSGIKKAAT